VTNPYTSPTASPPRPVPTVRPISWPATIPQLAALVAAMAVGWLATRSPAGAFGGAAAYLIYSYGSRSLALGAHRRGLCLIRAARFEEAIRAYQESYDFFSRHAWLDRYRSVALMSPSAMSFREIALVNIAFAYSQIGNGEKAKEFYQRALDEFPTSAMASAALTLIESIERSHVQSKHTE
jgi:tetratricopeptide (TPR) repeat protein